MKPAQSPRIQQISWGQLAVEGQEAVYKDAKLYPGGAREWDWKETGTRHVPGIQPSDVIELLDRGARVVVLSTGFHQRLEVSHETLEFLAERGVVAHILDTESAVRLYNSLREGEHVGALIHSTC